MVVALHRIGNMIKNNPAHDTVTPPGQVRYLRDVIKKYYEEEKGYEPSLQVQATAPLPDAEKRLQAVLGALAGLCKQQIARDGTINWWTQEIRKIIKDST